MSGDDIRTEPETPEDPPATTAATEPARATTPLTQQIGRITMIVIAILFGIFAVANSQYVAFDWIIGDTEVVERSGERVSGGVPLIVLLVASFVLGAIVAGFGVWRSQRRSRRRARPQEPKDDTAA